MGNTTAKITCTSVDSVKHYSPEPSAPPADCVQSEVEDPKNYPNIYPEVPPISVKKINIPVPIVKDIKEIKKEPTEEDILKLKRIKPSYFYKINSNLKTNLLLKNLQKKDWRIDNINLLKGEDRAIVDRRHVYHIIDNMCFYNSFILDYASNMEFLEGLYNFTIEKNKRSGGYYASEFSVITDGIKNRKFNKSEKKILGKIINITRNSLLNNDLTEYL